MWTNVIKEWLLFIVYLGVLTISISTIAAPNDSDESLLLKAACKRTMIDLPSFENVVISHVKNSQDLKKLLAEYNLFESHEFDRVVLSFFSIPDNPYGPTLSDSFILTKYQQLQRAMNTLTNSSEAEKTKISKTILLDFKNEIQKDGVFGRRRITIAGSFPKLTEAYLNGFGRIVTGLLASTDKLSFLSAVIWPIILEKIEPNYKIYKTAALDVQLKKSKSQLSQKIEAMPRIIGRQHAESEVQSLQASIQELKTAFREAYAQSMWLRDDANYHRPPFFPYTNHPLAPPFPKVRPLEHGNFENLANYEIELFAFNSIPEVESALSAYKVLAREIDIEGHWKKVLAASTELSGNFSRVNRIQLVQELTSFQIRMKLLQARHDVIKASYLKKIEVLDADVVQGRKVLDSNAVQMTDKVKLERQFDLLELRLKSLDQTYSDLRAQYEALRGVSKTITSALELLSEILNLLPTVHDSGEWEKYVESLTPILEMLLSPMENSGG